MLKPQSFSISQTITVKEKVTLKSSSDEESLILAPIITTKENPLAEPFVFVSGINIKVNADLKNSFMSFVNDNSKMEVSNSSTIAKLLLNDNTTLISEGNIDYILTTSAHDNVR